MMKKKWLLMLCLFGYQIAGAQKVVRFRDIVFPAIDSATDIVYGHADNIKGNNETLKLDLFCPPAGDTMKKRPLMIYIHGGGFQNNSKTGTYSSLICTGLAKMGYVTASIDYRLGVAKTKTNEDYFEALYRAVQDAKAAVRFFRKYADKYNIDSDQIFVMGSSAGAKTAMHLAYLDQSEVPAFVNTDKLGSLEGTSGNEGYSSKVAGVVNCWGAMINVNRINEGDVPMFNVAGTADQSVPFDSSYDYHGFQYGALILYHRLLSLGIPTGLRRFENTGHTLDNNRQKQDSAFKDIAQWLYTRLSINKPEKPEVFKWERDIQKLEAKDKEEKDPSDAVLFIGSSYIRMWENMKTDLSPMQTINRGFGGSKLSDVAYYIKRLVYPHTFKAIVIYVGNDIVGHQLDKTPLQDLELVKYITEQIRQKYPDVPIYWNSISPSEKRWAVWDKIQEANALIKDYCEHAHDLHFIDLGNSFFGKDGKPDLKLYKEDQLHYNEAGYKIWAKIIKEKFNQVNGK